MFDIVFENEIKQINKKVSINTQEHMNVVHMKETEFPIIGTSTQRAKLDGFFPIHILSQSITPAASPLNLGVTFDENFNFKQNISKTCRCCFTISVIFAVSAGLYHFPLHRNSSSKQQT